MPSPFRRGGPEDSVASAIPGIGALARLVSRVADVRSGRVPVGLLALLPVALLLDALDVADELLLGPVGMAASFVLEAAFLLGLTGRTTYALGLPFIDLFPVVDTIPFATLTLVKAILDAWNEGRDEGRVRPEGPVIDV